MKVPFHKRIMWRAIRMLGKEQQAWDDQFREGVWDRGPRSPEVVKRVQQFARGGRILEFGCGTGTLPRLLPEDSFSEYTGIDISGFAVEQAKKLCDKAGLQNCRFLQGDMATWPGSSDEDLILLEECLYYIRGVSLVNFCRLCKQSLSPDGTVLVIVHSAKKHRRTLEVCKQIFDDAVEEQVSTRTFLRLR